MKRTSRIRTEVSTASKNNPFKLSVESIIVERCDKLTQEIQKGNIKIMAFLMTSLEKDLALLHHSNQSYSRLHSLVYNTQATYYRKIGNNEEALKLIDEAISVEKSGHVDVIDRARTLLNKSVLMGQMARMQRNSKIDGLNVVGQKRSMMSTSKQGSLMAIDQNTTLTSNQYLGLQNNSVSNLYSHQAAIQLAKQALQMIKNRPEGKQLVQKDQYKLGELIIISFHNIATEMICLNNQKQAHLLFKKAFDISFKIMGPRHNLTQHLKTILTKYKQDKKRSKSKKEELSTKKIKNRANRIMTQENSIISEIKFNQRDSEDEKSMPTKVQPMVKIPNRIVSIQENKKKDKKKNQSGTTGISGKFDKKIDRKKYKSFMKVYGGGATIQRVQKERQQVDQMKELQKLQKIYKPTKSSNKYLPEINKKSIKEIINDGTVKKPMNLGYGEKTKNNMISSTHAIESSKVVKFQANNMSKSSAKIEKGNQMEVGQKVEEKTAKIQEQGTNKQQLQQKECQLI